MRALGWIGIGIGVGLLVGGGCTRNGPDPATSPASAAPPAATPPEATPPEATPPEATPPAAMQRTDAGRCTPMPKVSDACRSGDGWCVESWGEPGGHSSALWCRDGTWQREQEVNLPR
ncbi:MAG: hypothetical protein JNK45_12340 [Myxococcales bacterium]|nr:hypothetical protein [Myxococcales bacterium]